MNYIVFTSDLHLRVYENDLKFLMDFNPGYYLAGPVPDNYASHHNFGFRIDDDISAREHAFQVIEELRDESVDAIRRERLREQLCEDLKNYFLCLNMKVGKKKNDRPAKALIEAMAALDLEKELAEVVNEYYRTWFVKDEEEPEVYHFDAYPLEYIQLYRKMGDRALFLKEDIGLALQCYALADLDWHHLREEGNESSAASMRKDRYLLLTRWHEEFEYYRKLVSDKVSIEEIQKDQTLSTELRDIYCGLLEMEKQGADYLVYWNLANRYFEELGKMPRVAKDAIGRLRSRMFIAHTLREKAALAGLLCLKNESKEEKTKIADSVYKCIINSKHTRLQPLRNFSLNKSCSYELLENLLRFAETIDTTQQIRKALLVQDVPKDMAYYTALETFFYMLPAKRKQGEKCGRLSVMNIAYMNDPNEGKMLKKFIFQREDSFGSDYGRKSVRYPYVFMKCFTSRIDDLPMWEMYGNHAEGCCLILDWDKSVSLVENRKDVPLYRVCYIAKALNEYKIYKKDNPHISNESVKKIYNNLMRLRKLAAGFRGRQEAMDCFMILLEDILYLFKDSSYSYEEELRIYYNYPSYSDDFKHTGGEYPMLFVQPDFDVHLKEIIIGPKFKNIAERMPYIQEQVEKMCEETGGKNPRITKSAIEYK